METPMTQMSKEIPDVEVFYKCIDIQSEEALMTPTKTLLFSDKAFQMGQSQFPYT